MNITIFVLICSFFLFQVAIAPKPSRQLSKSFDSSSSNDIVVASSKSKPRRLKSSTSSVSKANIPALKAGQTVTIDEYGTVTAGETTLYERNPKLVSTKSKRFAIHNGELTINGVLILRRPSSSRDKITGNKSTTLGSGMKWMKIEVLQHGGLKIADEDENIINLFT